jgi:competence protein ComEC
MYSAAFAAGLALGAGSGGALSGEARFGLSADSVRGLSGVLCEDPRIVPGGSAAAVLSLRETSGSGGARVSAKGDILIFFPGESAGRLRETGRGARVFAEGLLRRRGGGEGAWYFSAESLHIVRSAPALERLRTGVRMDLIRRFDRASGGKSPAWGGLALALLLGVKDSLDSDLASRYRDAGCSYILALSGMHLAVLAALVALLLKKPLGLKAASAAGAVIIVLYCFLVGPLPSLNRAAIMYLLGVLAVLGFLKRDGLTLLGMAFLIQIVIAPSQAYSLSFILSYSALAGILSVGEALNAILRGKVPACLSQPLCASLGAFLATAGITAFCFGTLRPAGIAAGLVLVPLTTVFMTGSLAYLALDFFSPVLSGCLSPVLSPLYVLMEKTVSAAAALPSISAVPPPLVLALSLALSLFIIWFDSRRRPARNRLAAFP